MNRIVLFFVIILLNISVSAQVPVGEWRDHFSYRQAKSVAHAGDVVYVATDLALFVYDTKDHTFEKLSKLNGLSDAGIGKIAFNPNTNVLIISYINSNIDIITSSGVLNFPELKMKQIVGDKSIYGITVSGTKAYLACGFGIVVFDTETYEFSDTYIIGDDAGYLRINDITLNGDTLFAATEHGIKYCNTVENYAGDYRNWTSITNLPSASKNYGLVESFNNNLLCFEDEDDNGYGVIYYKTQNSWKPLDLSIRNIRDIYTSGEKLYITDQAKLKIFNNIFVEELLIDRYTLDGELIATSSMTSSYSNDNQILYITDTEHGLLIRHPNGSFEQVIPQGPYSNTIGRLSFAHNTVYTASSTLRLPSGQQSKPPYVNFFSNENWKTLRIPDVNDVITVQAAPDNSSHIFASTWWNGVYEYQDTTLVNHFNSTNSSIQNLLNADPDRFTLVYDIKHDLEGNLWCTNDLVGKPLSQKTPEGDWYAYELFFSGHRWVRNLLIRPNGDIWIDLFRNGLYCFNNNGTPENTEDDLHRSFYPQSADLEQSEQEIRCFAETPDGTIWVGTAHGIFVYYSPDNVFSDQNYYAERIKITMEYNEEQITGYLLDKDVITDIEVDGANRKWIGTESSGVFLVSESGKTEIHNFNTDNSPLISNTITDIEINDRTGEVLIATDKGLLGFRAEATEAGNEFGNVYVFPNPVRPGYEGMITLTGLAQGMNVKFTDVAGALVFETDALGGQAVWDGKNFDGKPAASGVYLFFCSNPDGTLTQTGKFLIIR